MGLGATGEIISLGPGGNRISHLAPCLAAQIFQNRPGRSPQRSSLAMAAENYGKTAPVIAITGTPGTGKTTTAQLLVEESPVPLRHINVGEWVKEKGLHEGFDQEWESYTVDEDKVRGLSIVESLSN